MIVRERKDAFVMIEQDNHANLSGEMIENWKEVLFQDEDFKESVDYAIRSHDYGWKYFDKQPFWNDKANKPYDFNDFPLASKIIVYQQGIDEVEKSNPYAALLCSEHYCRFLTNVHSEYATLFLQNEKERRQRLLKSFGKLNKRLFNFHYELLKFSDGLSLYFCINEPGVAKDDIHYFFRSGIALPSQLKLGALNIKWKDQFTAFLNPFPFQNPFSVKVKQKIVSKTDIKNKGLIDSYESTPYEELEFEIVPEKV